MQNKGQVFSLWIGPHSQQLAHHFYALQAEQFFNEQQDPLNHNYIWKLYDKYGERKKPYFLTFDTQIPHLNQLRHTNHSKLISQMQKSAMSLQEFYFPMDYKPKQKHQIYEEKDSYLYQRWQSDQSNYVIIDNNFIQDCESYDFWKDTFRMNSDIYQNRIRKQLQTFDQLQNITLSSDIERSGFSHQLILYLKEQCPKNDIVFFELETVKQEKGLFQVNKVSTLSEIGQLVDTFINFMIQKPKYSYFQTNNPYIHLAPLINSILTPLFLKSRQPGAYMNNLLINPRRNIFDLAFTLPLIDTDLNLSRKTNIFDYLKTNKHQKFFEAQESNMKVQNHEEQLKDIFNQDKNTQQNNEDNEFINKINFGADYLKINHEQKKKNQLHFYMKQNQGKNNQIYKGIISQAYLLKGHIKHFQKVFQPNSQLLDLKYLQGILCNYSGNNAKYTKDYIKSYGQIVQNYPFHCVMFQHEQFSTYLRKLASIKNKKNKSEDQSQWKQNLLSQADLYKQIINQEDD